MPSPWPPTCVDGTPAPVPRTDERSHQPGAEADWGESWYFDFCSAGGDLGGYVRLGLFPNQGVAWYWACLVGEGRPLVTVIDHHVPLPRTGLEIRTEGLWADHNLEDPLEHWSLGCEAFAVSVDDPADVYGDGDLRGDRVPFGIDLEWESEGTPFPYDATTRYEVPCRVTGEVLVGQERIEVDGPGQRDHSWGQRDWWTFGWCWTAAALEDGTRVHGLDVTVGEDPVYSTGYLQPPGAPMIPARVTGRGQDLGREQLPERGWTRLDVEAGDGLHLDIEPVAFAPVRVDASDGRVSRFPRALSRFTTPDGRRGTGWTEWNQPPAQP